MKNYFNHKKFMELLHNATGMELAAMGKTLSYLRAKAAYDKFLYNSLTKAKGYITEEALARAKSEHFFLDEEALFSVSKEEIEALTDPRSTLFKAKALRKQAGELGDLVSYKMMHLVVQMCKAYGDEKSA